MSSDGVSGVWRTHIPFVYIWMEMRAIGPVVGLYIRVPRNCDLFAAFGVISMQCLNSLPRGHRFNRDLPVYTVYNPKFKSSFGRHTPIHKNRITNWISFFFFFLYM